METLDLIRTRRSVRRFRKEKILSKTTDEILEAGRWASKKGERKNLKRLVLKEFKF